MVLVAGCGDGRGVTLWSPLATVDGTERAPSAAAASALRSVFEDASRGLDVPRRSIDCLADELAGTMSPAGQGSVRRAVEGLELVDFAPADELALRTALDECIPPAAWGAAVVATVVRSRGVEIAAEEANCAGAELAGAFGTSSSIYLRLRSISDEGIGAVASLVGACFSPVTVEGLLRSGGVSPGN